LEKCLRKAEMDANVLLGAFTYAGLLSLMSLGLTFTYLTAKVPNFAHGDYVALGGYVAYTLYVLSGGRVAPPYAIPAAFAVAGAVSYGIYALALRPLMRRGLKLADMMIAFLALEVILRSCILIYTDVMRESTKTYFTNVMVLDATVQVFRWSLPLTFVITAAMTALLLAALTVFLTKTRTGVALRASIENPALAGALGLNVDRYFSLAWFLAGGLTGLTGPVLLSLFPLSPGVGWSYNVRIFAASVLGGLESLPGSVVGGFAVGLSEVLGSYLLSKPPFNVPLVYRVVIPFSIMIAALLFMPRGIVDALNRLRERRVRQW